MSIDSTIYAHGRGRSHASLADAYQASQEPGNFAWIELFEPHEEDFEAIAESFGFDPGLLEDTIRFPQRTKIESHENLLVAAMPVVQALDEEENTRGKAGSRLGRGDWVLALAVGDPNSILTFVDGDATVLARLRHAVEKKPDRITEGSRAVLFEIVDEVIGGYEDAVEAIDQGIWDAEVAVLEGRSGNVLRQIHELTRRTVRLQQAVRPLVSALEQLTENGAPAGHRQLSHVRHRTLRVTERLDSSRELLSSLLNMNLTVVGQKISAWGAILIVPTLIAGVFGMNFTQEWWTKAEHGFEVMIAVMLLVSGTLYLWFRRSGWL